MSRFIPLPQSVTRCRPEAPLTKLHNDCGAQDRCARRLAANTNCLPTKDFSKVAVPFGLGMMCRNYVAIDGAGHATESHEAKTMQEPE